MKQDARTFASNMGMSAYDVHEVQGESWVACHSDIHSSGVLIVASDPKNL
jgi:hypothetical protein